ncbi:MAG: RagB/SusD family nutrient uptake outer membrane protein [Bacteroidales bacterium]|nr:RagB/SusD family nutrient uptake outer membrane protein [Bacteroidales bacterium]
MRTTLIRQLTVILTVLSILLVSSCKKDDPVDDVNDNDDTTVYFEGTLEDALADLDSVYIYLLTKIYDGWCSPLLAANLMSGDAIKGGDSDGDQYKFLELQQFDADAGNEVCYSLWMKYYLGIYHTNKILFNTSVHDIAGNEQMRGEALFFRAYFHFELLKLFKNIPVVNQYLPDHSYINTGLDLAGKCDLIVADLLQAAELLPLKSSLSPEDLFRPSKGAAQALLGKLYLYMASDYFNLGSSYYTDALAQFDEVINSGEYALMDDFGDNFIKTGEFEEESVFEISYYANESTSQDWTPASTGNIDCQFNGPKMLYGNSVYDEGWGFQRVKEELTDMFMNEDDAVRRSATVITLDEVLESGGTYNFENDEILGYPTNFNNKTTTKITEQESSPSDTYHYGTNDRIIRYSDVLLMAAEANLKIGNDPLAQTYLNEVRGRVDLDPVSATGAALFTAIKTERRLELALEGHRFFDLVRWGDADEIFAEEGFTEGVNEILPIPVSELIEHPELEQNPGY